MTHRTDAAAATHPTVQEPAAGTSPTPPATRIVVVHGLGATAVSHWFGALQERYTPYGIEVVVPDLPDSQAPDLDTWLSRLAEVVGAIDERTVLVGHSLGCVSILQHLAARDDDWRLGGLALVAGFVEQVPGIPEVDHFVARETDPAGIAARTARRLVVSADDDPVVPRRLTEDLARGLDADLIVVDGAGHFLARGGFDRLAVLESVLDGWTLTGSATGRPAVS
ncbi:RBBP9/YdeN family alpha/beta hydrolase [Oerskovia enterophila]|uniref:Hydrolase YdeN n=1 Tax=Oerskovia enterophila TaxID=43678 RepID=A0A163SCA2_9CELL|nr:alpha/beta fold hydrolase [Oerskovia enterophila]KZM36244.1 putative hydrolase YdeN [Oerskovia enterophila]OCI33043.1 putative hydrolase YdeN [Oerskovia enterophila]